MGVSYLEAEDLRLDQREGLAVDLNKTLALLLKVSVSVLKQSQVMI